MSRGTHEQEHHLHESPPSITIPLIVLAIFATIAGFIGIPYGIGASVGVLIGLIIIFICYKDGKTVRGKTHRPEWILTLLHWWLLQLLYTYVTGSLK